MQTLETPNFIQIRIAIICKLVKLLILLVFIMLINFFDFYKKVLTSIIYYIIMRNMNTKAQNKNAYNVHDAVIDNFD